MEPGIRDSYLPSICISVSYHSVGVTVPTLQKRKPRPRPGDLYLVPLSTQCVAPHLERWEWGPLDVLLNSHGGLVWTPGATSSFWAGLPELPSVPSSTEASWQIRLGLSWKAGLRAPFLWSRAVVSPSSPMPRAVLTRPKRLPWRSEQPSHQAALGQYVGSCFCSWPGLLLPAPSSQELGPSDFSLSPGKPLWCFSDHEAPRLSQCPGSWSALTPPSAPGRPGFLDPLPSLPGIHCLLSSLCGFRDHSHSLSLPLPSPSSRCFSLLISFSPSPHPPLLAQGQVCLQRQDLGHVISRPPTRMLSRGGPPRVPASPRKPGGLLQQELSTPERDREEDRGRGAGFILLSRLHYSCL